MRYLVKTEIFGQGNDLEDTVEVVTAGWEGLWDVVHAEIERSGKIPNGLGEPGAVKDWIEAAWSAGILRGSFHFPGASWSSVTFTWHEEDER